MSLGQQKHATPAQIALAWLLAYQQTIYEAASKITVQGARLPEHVLKLTNG